MILQNCPNSIHFLTSVPMLIGRRVKRFCICLISFCITRIKFASRRLIGLTSSIFSVVLCNILVQLKRIPLFASAITYINKKAFLVKLTLSSLFFNSFLNCALITDTLMDPVVFLGENFTRVFGPIFFLIVIFMIVSVTAVFYICLLPHVWADSKWWTSLHLGFGHLVLVNTLFHYYKASFTDPGAVPNSDGKVLPEVVSICKKCIAPKPPRTHHCSVCKRCVLKMDHHCPWLNNCVGFYNHRHFFMFTVWIWFGAVYISVIGYDRFKEHYFGTKFTPRAPGLLSLSHLVTEMVGDVKTSKSIVGDLDRKAWMDNGNEPPATWLRVVGKESTTFPNGSLGAIRPLITMNEAYFHSLVIYEFMVGAAVSVAILGLIGWHAYLITRGETSIEVHLNKKRKASVRKTQDEIQKSLQFWDLSKLENIFRH